MSYIIIGGIDDATKCPCIGSIFLAGVVADQKIIAKWRKLGIKDSKLLTRKKRDEFATIIQETALAFSVKEITPAMIDNKQLNLNEWEMLICLDVMQELQAKVIPHYMFVDNWETSPILFFERYKNIVQRNHMPYSSTQLDQNILSATQVIPEHQADEKYTVVGAASILAKSGSDRQYDEYRTIYGNFGSGNPGDPTTRKFVWQHRDNPPPIIRTSWKTFDVLSQIETLEDDPLRIKKEHVSDDI